MIEDLTGPFSGGVSYAIKIENPLPYAASFNSECKLNDISVPLTFTIPPNADVSFSKLYLPTGFAK